MTDISEPLDIPENASWGTYRLLILREQDRLRDSIGELKQELKTVTEKLIEQNKSFSKQLTDQQTLFTDQITKQNNLFHEKMEAYGLALENVKVKIMFLGCAIGVASSVLTKFIADWLSK